MILKLVRFILTSSTISVTDYGIMEVLTGNPHWEAGKIASYSYFPNKYFYRYCAMATLFSFFPPDKCKKFVNPYFVSCGSWKIFLGVRSWYCNKMPIIWVCVDILQRIFSALMESDSLSQKSGCPNFCNSIRNIYIKNNSF